MSTKIYSTLRLNDLELMINLGWDAQERTQKQKVLLNLLIQFPVPPKACQTDKLEDTICYDQLIEKIRKEITNKHFCLIEHLTAEIYSLIKNNVPQKTKIILQLTKYPDIQGLTEGASFSYWDQP